jgi:hypothetical protein
MKKDNEITGKIISTQLGVFGRDELRYGYISVQTKDNKVIKIKIDSYTTYETLNLGDRVVVETEFLGDTNILVARKVHHAESDLSHQTNTAKAAT